MGRELEGPIGSCSKRPREVGLRVAVGRFRAACQQAYSGDHRIAMGKSLHIEMACGKACFCNVRERPMSISRAESDLAQAKMEMQRLERDLKAAQERAIKIQHYLEMARLYDMGTTVSADRSPGKRRQRSGKSAIYTRAAIETLRRAGHPMKTRALVRALSDQGIEIGGKDPVITLSGSLSRSGELEMPDRAAGWVLKEWAESRASSPGAVDQESNDDDDDASEPSEIVATPPNGPESRFARLD
jgi:hypothetical protein